MKYPILNLVTDEEGKNEPEEFTVHENRVVGIDELPSIVLPYINLHEIGNNFYKKGIILDYKYDWKIVKLESENLLLLCLKKDVK